MIKRFGFFIRTLDYTNFPAFLGVVMAMKELQLKHQ